MDERVINGLIGGYIRKRRFLLGLTQKALADKLGISYQQIQKYESGTNGVSCAKLWKISAVLGCTMDELCRDPADALRRNQVSASHRTQKLVAHFHQIHSESARAALCDMAALLANVQ